MRDLLRKEKPINTKEKDKIHLKSDCVKGSLFISIRETDFYNFASDKLPDHKIYKKPRIKPFKKISKPVFISYHN